nr:hypothetical protein CFP56_00022 [Quercus suber]
MKKMICWHKLRIQATVEVLMVERVKLRQQQQNTRTYIQSMEKDRRKKFQETITKKRRRPIDPTEFHFHPTNQALPSAFPCQAVQLWKFLLDW